MKGRRGRHGWGASAGNGEDLGHRRVLGCCFSVKFVVLWTLFLVPFGPMSKVVVLRFSELAISVV